MRYYYKKPTVYRSLYGRIYICDHPVYNRCTLYQSNNNGLAVIQQRYDPKTKATYWTEIDPWLVDDLYLHPNFNEVFRKRAGECTNQLYPTMTVRQLMWMLKMKPIKREPWETYFVRKNI